ncbi:hypothetical protein EW026_g4841 [Hermanssonia centrifuga]|uniref:Histone deacetylase domain-containing protein n=1 Tax=Hermanssonia centrifuga TaxID=98765 RepID=A0A4S4KKE1_9APHY|nr:hypothetical protein EW026_g4841 [Hermanssonia centrifuga]
MSKRAFVVIRPPGHHCGEDNPNGFCFVNDVAVGAAHAYTEHNIRYAVIFDIDLHHGNGTQAITWEINHDTHMDQAGMRIFYGSIHDILSYPCEEGKADAIKDASISIGGQYGQWIENIHLRPYQSDEQFWLDYESLYSKIFEKAAAFVENAAKGEEVMVFLSCGFDASEYESDAMSRHGSKVPTTFYHRFTRDACKFADRFSNGRIVSVMEGGYSDRALTSGAMAHVCGLVDSDGGKFNVDPDWWSFENLLMLEKYTQKRKGRPARTTFLAPWLQRTLDILPLFSGAPSTSQVLIPPSRKRDPPPTKTGRPRGRPRKHPLPLAGSSSISSTTTTTTTSSKGPKRTLPERQAAASSKRRRLDITAHAQDAPDSATGQQAIGQSTQPSVVGEPIEQGEAQTAGLESVASTSSVPRDLRLAFAEEIRKLKKLEENIAAFQVAYRPDLQNPHINWVRTQRLKEVLQSWEMDGLT